MLIAKDDVRLNQRALPVERVRKDHREHFDMMLETMRANDGIGIAAPQVGVMSRLCIIQPERNRPPMFMANPHIYLAWDGFVDSQEGCLSFPGVGLSVQRARRIAVKFLDYHGQRKHAHLETAAASICAQHEIDHLDGVTFFARAYQQGIQWATVAPVGSSAPGNTPGV